MHGCVQAQTEAGRAALWKVNAPTLLAKGYEYEEHPGVCQAMESAAEVFMANGGVTTEDEDAVAGRIEEIQSGK